MERKESTQGAFLPNIAGTGLGPQNAGAPQARLDGKANRKKCVPHFAPSHDFLFHLSDETTGVPKDPPPLLKQFIHQMQISAGVLGQRKQRVMPPHMLPQKAATARGNYEFSRRDQVPPMSLAGGAPNRIAPRQDTNYIGKIVGPGGDEPTYAALPSNNNISENQQPQQTQQHHHNNLEDLEEFFGEHNQDFHKQGPPPIALGDSRFAPREISTPSSSRSVTSRASSVRSFSTAVSSARNAGGPGMTMVSEERLRRMEEKLVQDEVNREQMMQKLDALQNMLASGAAAAEKKKGGKNSGRRNHHICQQQQPPPNWSVIPQPPKVGPDTKVKGSGKGGIYGGTRVHGILPSRKAPM